MKVQLIALVASFLNVAFGDLSFLVMGDWGGVGVWPYHTPGQKQAAAGMGVIAEKLSAEFVVALGDNFYSSGVETVDSNRFEKTWSDVYNAESLKNKNFYVIAGNHDHKSNVSAQIAYTAIDPTKRWQFPHDYHKQSFKDEATGITLDLILIDTVELADMNEVQDESVPGYFNALPPKTKSYTAAAENQWTWIETEMANSKADYLLVGGHYPVYSVCEHGPTATLIENLKPLLEKYNAHYMSGHDHCMEHFVEGGTNYILSGLGDTCCYEDSNLNNPSIPANILQWYVSRGHKPSMLLGGFTSVTLSPTEMTIQYYDGEGKVLFKANPVSKRSVQA